MGEEMIFVGIGGCVLLCVLSWGFYHMFRIFKIGNDTEELHETAHQVALKRYCAKKGMDLDKEMMRLSIIDKLKNKRSIRRRLEYETYKELFGDDKDIPD